MLHVEGLSVAYGSVQILWDVSFTVEDGEIVTIIGPNGAGKTTLVNAIIGLLRPLKGRIRLRGEYIEGLPPYEIVERGMTLIPGGRNIFPRLSVEENLLIGAYTVKDKQTIKSIQERAYNIFTVLKKKRQAIAKTLSGGEQQMLVICRGLMSNPNLLIIDEPSLGLAPILVQKMLDTVSRIRDDGVTILLVEQNIHESLAIADRGYVLEEGRIRISGEGRDLLANEHIREAYLGI